MKNKRLKPAARKEDILAAALKLAAEEGYKAITRNQIAGAVGVNGSVINYHFGTVGQLRRDLMRYAVEHECLRVIAQGLTAGDPHAQKAPEGLRRRALGAYLV